MEYISTRNKIKKYSFKDVFLKGLPSDGGLFVPKKIPSFSSKDLKKIKKLTYKKLATEVILKFCGNEFKKSEIKNIVNKSYKKFRVNNVIKIRRLKKISLIELFHGPTLAFKDIAMQMIGNMYSLILKKNNLNINVIVATSGDTGAAAINAIKNKKNIKIFVLHPYGKISDVQRKFMTTINSKNVFNIALDGNFDLCQSYVKSMFADENFRRSIKMSGVNSINWSRIIAQVVYYFYSYFKVAKTGKKINFSVPTGNFGDIYSGYVAKRMGLPINKLIIATNNNDILKRVFNTGIYEPRKVKYTISPSMDIQVASNFERLIFDSYSCNSKEVTQLMRKLKINGKFKIKKKNLNKIKSDFCSESVSEKETKSIIKNIYESEKLLIDPHTAVGVGAAKKIFIKGETVVLSTAHPAKFSKVVFEQTGVKPKLPGNLKKILFRKERFKKLPKNIKKLKRYIIQNV